MAVERVKVKGDRELHSCSLTGKPPVQGCLRSAPPVQGYFRAFQCGERGQVYLKGQMKKNSLILQALCCAAL